jgi:hypothetical protein
MSLGVRGEKSLNITALDQEGDRGSLLNGFYLFNQGNGKKSN